VQDWPEYFIGVSVVVFLVVVFDHVGEHGCLMSALNPLQAWSGGNLTTPTKCLDVASRQDGSRLQVLRPGYLARGSGLQHASSRMCIRPWPSPISATS
jgi:hypothetical protein